MAAQQHTALGPLNAQQARQHKLTEHVCKQVMITAILAQQRQAHIASRQQRHIVRQRHMAAEWQIAQQGQQHKPMAHVCKQAQAVIPAQQPAPILAAQLIFIQAAQAHRAVTKALVTHRITCLSANNRRKNKNKSPPQRRVFLCALIVEFSLQNHFA